MSFGEYFIKGQKDTIPGYAVHSEPMQLDLALPYGSDAADSYPFEPGMQFEIMTDSRGMGLRLTASFVEKISRQDIRLEFAGDLEFISRRSYQRVDVNAWVGLQRGEGSLAEMRQTWRDHLEKIKLREGLPPMRGKAVVLLHGLAAPRWSMKSLKKLF